MAVLGQGCWPHLKSKCSTFLLSLSRSPSHSHLNFSCLISFSSPMYPFQLTPSSLSTLYLFLSFSAFLFLLYQPVTHSLCLVFPSVAADFYLSEELSFYLIEILFILQPAGNQTPTWILLFAVDFLIGI